MTFKEFFKFKGWTDEDAKHFLGGYWNKYFFKHIENRYDTKITNFEVFCEYPFYKLNQIYNGYYNKDNSIGSFYEWLGETATDSVIEQYLGKERG